MERDSRAEYYWQLGTTDMSPLHFNLSHEELMKLQLDIIRNFTRLYGSAALGKGQLQGDVILLLLPPPPLILRQRQRLRQLLLLLLLLLELLLLLQFIVW